MRRGARRAPPLALACGLALVARAGAAQAQSAGYVVPLPFGGVASEALLHEAEDGVAAVLRARGYTVAERASVRSALGVAPPSSTQELVGFGRSMGATYVLAGTVRPLAGQYNLELHWVEVSSARVAVAARNLGVGEEAAEVPLLLDALLAPAALQASPEERARLEAEARAAEEERQRQRAEQERRERLAREREERAARARQAQLDRERDEATRRNAWSVGGRWSAGGGLVLGGRVTGVGQRPEGAPAPAVLTAGLRAEAGYALFPRLGPVGLELGGAVQALTTPTVSLALGAAARLVFPSAGWSTPLRGSVGLALGPYFGLSGARSVSAWLALDLRGEYDFTQGVAAYASLGVDGAPGVVGSIVANVGLRFRFGESGWPAPEPVTAEPDAPAR